MSHRHIRMPEAPPQPLVWWRVALWPGVIVVLVCAVWVIANWVHGAPGNYETAHGRILEMRQVVDGVRDSKYGGRIVYGVQARVQYSVNGQMQERWLRASDHMGRESLALKLAQNPTECLVYWPPEQPENARCWLE